MSGQLFRVVIAIVTFSWPWIVEPARAGDIAETATTTPAATTPAWTFPDTFLPPEGTGGDTDWPEVSAESRPGAYWWWPGSAVTKSDITWNLETYRQAGWGNLGVIGIYGVRGEEDRFLDFFSPTWFEMFNHAVTEAKRLGMNIDLTPSSGWRMGGPHVTPGYGGKVFSVSNGQIVVTPSGARVKRAGPGGAGLAINPYSQAAVAFHLDWVDQRFEQGAGRAPRAFYYDSFENPGNWCPELLSSFRTLRGYSLDQHANQLGGQGETDPVRRVICDYRETLSDVLIDRVRQIVDWGNQRGSALRMQAHGAPANLLDMYAAAEIPETEVFGASTFDIPGYRRDPKLITHDQQSDLVNRFSSSAAHVAGHNIVISESFTWLRNHFHTTLAHCKAESDKLLLNGVNCIYYHGLCYSPKKTAWPGWLFYASTQGNARNSIFRDIPALNAYLTRCQSILQEGQPFNDVLLYWPVYDLWMADGNRERRFSVHRPEWIEGTTCGEAGRWMIKNGYTFDFASDRQLLDVIPEGQRLRTKGGNLYKTVLVPAAKFMTIDTLRHIVALADAGATVLIWRQMPQDVPGWLESKTRKQRLNELTQGISFDSHGVVTVGEGKIAIGEELEDLLAIAGIDREPMTDHGLQFIRRRNHSHISYFIANHTAKTVDAWIGLAPAFQSALLMDPMTAKKGRAQVKMMADRTAVRLQLQPGETRVLRLFRKTEANSPIWPIVERTGKPIRVLGTWQVEMVEGGPVLPKRFTTDQLQSWTSIDDEQVQRFAGAARYSIAVNVPGGQNDGWFLNLGDVRESARVWVNDQPAGIVVAHPFQVDLGRLLNPGLNRIAIEVTNLSANRIRDLDLRAVPWKKFHDINIVSQLYKPLNAATWPLKPSGLLGPVTLEPYRVVGTDD